MIHDKNSSREAPGLPADCREDVPASCEGRLGVQRQNNNVSSGLCSAEPIGNQVPKPVSSGRVVLHPGTRTFWPGLGDFTDLCSLRAEHTVALQGSLAKYRGRPHALAQRRWYHDPPCYHCAVRPGLARSLRSPSGSDIGIFEVSNVGNP